jgi:guanylate kinase
VSVRRGIPFVVSAPSGTGKTTVCRAVVERDPGIGFSVSHTTRAPRPGEVDGTHYFFVDRTEFTALVARGAFVEHAEYAGNLYGTSWASLDGPLAQGRDLLLEVEVQGARQIRARRADARFVFLLPPSLEDLERRLRARATDSSEAVAARLAMGRAELLAVHDFDYAVVNDELEGAIEALLAIVRAERRGDTAEVRERFGRDRTLARVGARLGIAA